MSGPRAYSTGTERALFHLANGTCYFPECKRRVVELVGGVDEWVVAVDIAHIYGAKEGSARYDPGMTDDQRRAMANLILLCTAHHKLVDRVRPEDFPADMLKEWKVASEGASATDLAGLHLDDVSSLEKLITELVRKLGPKRDVAVELRAGFILPDGSAMAYEFGARQTLLAHNAGLHLSSDVLVIEVVNRGSLAVEVTSVDICWAFRLDGAAEPAEVILTGRNEYPLQNPALPHRLLDGARGIWMTSGNTIREHCNMGGDFVSLRGTVQLATGETISTTIAPRELVRDAGFFGTTG